jgi:hypothetical protein
MVNGVTRQKLVLVAALALASLGLASAAWGQATSQASGSAAAPSNAGVANPLQQQSQLSPPTMRDAAGTLAAIDGVIQGGEDQSGFSNGGVSGVFDTISGVGAQGASPAFGGSLSVVTPANRGAAVNPDQTNTDDVSASSTLTGGVTNAQ